MKINLIPVCAPGYPYGGVVINEAIERFKKYLLSVVIVYQKETLEFTAELAAKEIPTYKKIPTSRNVFKADFVAVIALFRESNTIGQVTGFIQLDGMNLDKKGKLGECGSKLLDCLTQNKIEPWFYDSEEALVRIMQHTELIDWDKITSLPLVELLSLWEKFVVDHIVPHFYSTSFGAFNSSRKTGSWSDSWKADDN
ncbi:MAG: hypothetical protein PUP93_27395 [Rhizonema sp. NSF051]|nr:hypothetical protein [Rhizonema sp. NSF051]